MAYVNKQNLSDFWTNAKRYIAARDADQCDWTSVPVNAPVYQFEAEPRTPVNPVVEFGFTETPPAEGEKSPTNPSTITGVDSITVTRYGKNILPSTPVHSDAMTDRGVTVTTNSDGSIHLQGTVTANLEAYLTYFNNAVGGVVPEELAIGKTVTVSLQCSDSNVYAALYRSNSTSAWGSPITIPANSETTYTVTPDIKSAMFRIVATRGSVLNCDVYCQIEYGSEATAWEPPAETTATISLGETRYGGTLDVATGKMTVTHVGYDIGESTTSYSTSNTVFFFDTPKTSLSTLPVCESFVYHAQISNFADLPDGQFMPHVAATPATQTRWIFKASNYSTIEEFKSAFTGKKLVYQLDIPITIDLDPQQLFSALSNSKVNTVFTDTGTISQLTYAKPAPSQEDVFRYANWHRTELAGAVACYPVPESELHPMVNFSFTETPPASGDKSPSNPSTITGISNVNVYHAGKNLIPPNTGLETYNWGVEKNGITLTKISDAFIQLNGTATTNTSINLPPRINLPVGITYTLSGADSDASVSTYRIVCWQASNAAPYDSGDGVTFVKTKFPEGTLPSISVVNGCAFTNKILKIQIELGSQKTEFESPILKNHNIPLNGTYYGGSIDLSTGLMTVTQVGYELDSSLTWSTSSADYVYRTVKEAAKTITGQNYGAIIPLFKSSHYTITTSDTASMPLNSFYARADGNIIINTGNLSMQDFKDWLDAQKLAGTPVVVTYPLAVPKTVQLTPTQIKALPALDKHEPRVNTLYTDADSIQVSYQKSPIQTELELTDAILALGGGE